MYIFCFLYTQPNLIYSLFIIKILCGKLILIPGQTGAVVILDDFTMVPGFDLEDRKLQLENEISN